MLKKQRPSLASAPFRASLIIILTIALFIGIFWTINEYHTYHESITNIRDNYQQLYRSRVREEVDNVINLIEHQRAQADLRIENELREKVQSAYTISSHIYRLYKQEKSVAALRSMVAEILRPIRWNNARGYYFSGRLTDSTIDLFADDPVFEGQGLDQIHDQSGRPVSTDIKTILLEKGAGVYRFRFVEKNFPNKSFPTIIFVKYFKPFDWFIGAAVSNEEMEKVLKRNILSTMYNMQFGGDGHILCFRFDGTIISHPDEKNIGRSITDLVDGNGESFGKDLLEAGIQPGGFGFTQYTVVTNSSGKNRQRLSYVRAYPDWNWIVTADMSMDTMEKAILDETRTYASLSYKNIFIFIGLFGIAVLFLLSSAYFYSNRIKRSISLFTDFFKKAADNLVKIRDTDLTFTEFETLAKFANTMVDDRIQKELILRRDELRLDTLLQLGMMEDYDIKDKYDFVLYRIIQITGSKTGYIALVNEARTHISICSRVTVGSGRFALDNEVAAQPLAIEESGVIKICIKRAKVQILNTPAEVAGRPACPYRKDVHRRLDIPVIIDNRVVLVAGVCNGMEDYATTDIRQMTMLLSGMWLHIRKICLDKELTKLERQVIAISEEERSKIGRDLHDDLGSHLSGVEILSKVLQLKLEKQVPALAEQLASVRSLIREAIDKTRRLSQGLYPVHVIEQGMEAAIEELLVEIKQLYTVKCTLFFDSRVVTIGSNFAPHIYYIIREALFNSAKHGKPETIQVIVLRKAHRLFVTITDDGQGIMQYDRHKGMGLHTMHYRAKAIGANLDIQPGETCGTVVTLTGEVFK